jgi:MoaA/NifB/PqqE/SkfB family radical SAM enzyme
MRPLTFVRDLWRHRQGRPTSPRFLTYLVTFRCNARCVMCDSWRKPSPDELTLPEIEAVFAQLPRLDGVRLSGGEPFLRPDFAEIGRLAIEKLEPRFLHITTNGFLTRSVVEFCERRPRTVPLMLLVSLDGTEAKHNEVRGRPRAWEQAFATVQALAPRQRELGLRLGVNQTIVDQDGLAEHRKLRALLEPMGVPVNGVVAYAASATYSLECETEAAPAAPGDFTTFGDLPPEFAHELLAELEAGLAGRSWAERLAKGYYIEGLRGRLLHRDASPNPGCVALNAHLRLLPNGDVPVCQFNSRIVGNLRRQRLDAVWTGDPIRREREWVRRCAGCWAECEVLPNAVYSGDALRHVLRPVLPAGWQSSRPRPLTAPGSPATAAGAVTTADGARGVGQPRVSPAGRAIRTGTPGGPGPGRDVIAPEITPAPECLP